MGAQPRSGKSQTCNTAFLFEFCVQPEAPANQYFFAELLASEAFHTNFPPPLLVVVDSIASLTSVS